MSSFNKKFCIKGFRCCGVIRKAFFCQVGSSKSDLPPAIFGVLAHARARRDFLLGYKVHTACCTSSELPIAFTVQPCNLNEKSFIKLLLEKLYDQGISFKAVLADTQYDSQRFGGR